MGPASTPRPLGGRQYISSRALGPAPEPESTEMGLFPLWRRLTYVRGQVAGPAGTVPGTAHDPAALLPACAARSCRRATAAHHAALKVWAARQTGACERRNIESF